MKIGKVVLALGVLSMVVSSPTDVNAYGSYMSRGQWTRMENPYYDWLQNQVWVNGYWQYSSEWASDRNPTVYYGGYYYDAFNDNWIYNWNDGSYDDVKYIYIPN